MLKRTVTAIIAITLFIPICCFSDTFIYPLAFTVLSVISVYEMLRCIGTMSPAIAIPSYIFAAALPLITVLCNDNVIPLEIASCLLYLLVMLTVNVFSRGKFDYTQTASVFMSVFYLATAFASIVFLRTTGKYLYLLVFIGPWVSDIFAYLFGRLFGRHKLIPEVSPHKTVEGSIAGILFATLAFVGYGLVIKRFFDPTVHPHMLVMALAGAFIAVISQIGDLTASVIKRRYNVKDFGWILPGHGGIIDRFDSVLLTAPFLYILTQIPFLSGMLL